MKKLIIFLVSCLITLHIFCMEPFEEAPAGDFITSPELCSDDEGNLMAENWNVCLQNHSDKVEFCTLVAGETYMKDNKHIKMTFKDCMKMSLEELAKWADESKVPENLGLVCCGSYLEDLDWLGVG